MAKFFQLEDRRGLFDVHVDMPAVTKRELGNMATDLGKDSEWL